MTLKEYLNRPSGEISAIELTERRNTLDGEYNDLKYDMSLAIFRINDKNLIYFVEIPSRHAKGLRYQVVFQFNLEYVESASDVSELSFKCFSNCPSFVYTYAKVFKEKDMFCNWLGSKLDRPVLKKDPSIRNPDKNISYERSIYLAAKYIINSGKSKIDLAKIIGLRVASPNVVKNKILTQSTIEDRYKSATKSTPKSNESKKSTEPGVKNKHEHAVSQTQAVEKIKSIKNTNSIKAIKKTKRI